MNFFGIIFLSIIIEGIITYIREFFVNGRFQWQMLISIIVGILVTAAYQVDIIALVGLQTPVPFLGSVLTGILISRGSNYIFDLINTISTLQGKAA